MADGIYTAVSGAIAQQQALEVAANNLANISTAGFKGSRVSFQDAMAQLPDQKSGTTVHVKVAQIDNDFSQGSLRMTQNPLDLALQGPGFFVVDTPDGQRLSRNGALSQRPDGVLQNSDGFALMGHAGPVRPPAGAPLKVDEYGMVFAGPLAVDRLQVVDVEKLQALRREAHGLWNPAATATFQIDTRVQSGALEVANVNAVQTMTGLIAIQRAYESYHKSIETMRTSEQKLTNEVG